MSVNPINSSAYYCIPRPGKPGPYAADGVSRVWVPQLPQKGGTCTYYALQILLNEQKIGKNPPEHLLHKRGIQIIISKHRKGITKVDDQFQLQITFAKVLKKYVGGGLCTKQQARQFVEEEFDQKILPEHKEQFSTCLESFYCQNTHEDFSSFIQEGYQKARMEVYEQFFHDFNVSSEFIERTAFDAHGIPWAELSIDRKYAHEANKVFIKSCLEYGCQTSSWHPEQPIGNLIKQLRSRGPHLVVGKIGMAYYEVRPMPYKVDGRSVFRLVPNAAKKAGIQEGHAVVIVGAFDIKGLQQVSFLDPNDGSDPSDVSTQKIYLISYEELKKSIHAIDGYGHPLKEDGTPIFTENRKEDNDYAIYMEKQ